MQNQAKRARAAKSNPKIEKLRAPAVARAADILRLLSIEHSGLGVTDIARRVGLVPSTCFHVLRALVDEDFTYFDSERKTYQTGVGLLAVVREAMANNRFVGLAQKACDELSDKYGFTSTASEVDGRGRIVVVAVTRAVGALSLHVSVGSRMPVLIGASGRLIAARSGLSRAELKTRFDALRWEKAPRFDDWYAELEEARLEGVAVDRGNYLRGLTIVTTLLPEAKKAPTRALTVVGLDHHLTERMLRQLRPDLRAKATRLGEELASF